MKIGPDKMIKKFVPEGWLSREPQRFSGEEDDDRA
jgi:hypothetical protein